MATEPISMSVDLKVVETYCGHFVLLTARQLADLRRSHGVFYCPFGHGASYKAETAEEKLARENDRLRGCLTESQDRIGDLLSTLGDKRREIQRIQRRADNGVCPHCRRTFKQVGRHIKRKHPHIDVRVGVQKEGARA